MQSRIGLLIALACVVCAGASRHAMRGPSAHTQQRDARFWSCYAGLVRDLRSDAPADGHSTGGHWPARMTQYATLAAGRDVDTICETGFGTGSDAATFLCGSRSASLIAWGIMSVDEAQRITTHFDRHFPGRFKLTHVNTHDRHVDPVPHLAAMKCDIVALNGDFDTITADLRSFVPVVHETTILLVNSVNCVHTRCTEPTRAWDRAIQNKQIANTGCLENKNEDHGWCSGLFRL